MGSFPSLNYKSWDDHSPDSLLAQPLLYWSPRARTTGPRGCFCLASVVREQPGRWRPSRAHLDPSSQVTEGSRVPPCPRGPAYAPGTRPRSPGGLGRGRRGAVPGAVTRDPCCGGARARGAARRRVLLLCGAGLGCEGKQRFLFLLAASSFYSDFWPRRGRAAAAAVCSCCCCCSCCLSPRRGRSRTCGGDARAADPEAACVCTAGSRRQLVRSPARPPARRAARYVQGGLGTRCDVAAPVHPAAGRERAPGAPYTLEAGAQESEWLSPGTPLLQAR